MAATNKAIVPELITSKNGLNYCCLWAFFSMFHRTEQIAMRLGVTSRTIRLYKVRFRDGEFACENCQNCMKKAVVQKKKRY